MGFWGQRVALLRFQGDRGLLTRIKLDRDQFLGL